MDATTTREAIRTCKALTNKPFGVNVMLMNPDTENIMKVICEEKVAVVTTGAGNPGPYIEALKASGTKIFPVVASVALARRLEKPASMESSLKVAKVVGMLEKQQPCLWYHKL